MFSSFLRNGHVHAHPVVVDGHGVEGDVEVAESDVDADAAHDLIRGEGPVRARNLRLANVP